MKSRMRKILISILALSMLSLTIVPALAHETWNTGLPMPTHREGYGAAVISYLKTIYYVDGHNASYGDMNIVEAYNVSTNTWTTGLATDPGGPRAELAAVSNGTHVFAVGGRYSGTVLDTLTMYDPVADSWTTLASMPTPAVTEHCVAYHGGAIYVAGGRAVPQPPMASFVYASDPVLQTLQMYNISENTWYTLAPLPIGVADGALVSKGNKLFLVGGWKADFNGTHYTPTWLDTIYVYDIDEDSWDLSSTHLSMARADLAAAVAGNRLYAIGGYNGLSTTDTVEVFKITGKGIKSSRPGPSLLSPTAECQGVYTGGRIFVAGGGYRGAPPVPSGIMQILDTQQGGQ